MVPDRKGVMGAGSVLECRRNSPKRGKEVWQRAVNKNLPYIAGLGRAAELLTSDNMWRDNADRMERMRSHLMNRLTI